jgi:hypothetical protein
LRRVATLLVAIGLIGLLFAFPLSGVPSPSSGASTPPSLPPEVVAATPERAEADDSISESVADDTQATERSQDDEVWTDETDDWPDTTVASAADVDEPEDWADDIDADTADTVESDEYADDAEESSELEDEEAETQESSEAESISDPI